MCASNMTSIILAGVLSIIGTLIGVLVGSWLNRKNSIKVIGTHEFIKAGNKFKSAFSSAIDIISESPLVVNVLMDLWKITDNQKAAFNEFIIYLPVSKRGAFRKAWSNYQRADEDDFIAEYAILEPIDENILAEKRRLIIVRIEKLFHFTEP